MPIDQKGSVGRSGADPRSRVQVPTDRGGRAGTVRQRVPARPSGATAPTSAGETPGTQQCRSRRSADRTRGYFRRGMLPSEGLTRGNQSPSNGGTNGSRRCDAQPWADEAPEEDRDTARVVGGRSGDDIPFARSGDRRGSMAAEERGERRRSRRDDRLGDPVIRAHLGSSAPLGGSPRRRTVGLPRRRRARGRGNEEYGTTEVGPRPSRRDGPPSCAEIPAGCRRRRGACAKTSEQNTGAPTTAPLTPKTGPSAPRGLSSATVSAVGIAGLVILERNAPVPGSRFDPVRSGSGSNRVRTS